VARQIPVPQSEKEIGLRLAQVRELLLISKSTFALEIGITREKLYNYETGRTPLPWDIGHFVCNAFDVNPLWLATGKWDMFLPFGFGDDRDINKKLPFSEAVRTLPDELKNYCQTASGIPPKFSHKKGFNLEQIAHDQLKNWFQKIPVSSQRAFMADLKKSGDTICLRYSAPEKPAPKK
jgi:DNA-binding XRE family transcriptional regulator